MDFTSIDHPLDIETSNFDGTFSVKIEEMVAARNNIDDCFGTISSFSTATGCAGSAATFTTIISCGS